MHASPIRIAYPHRLSASLIRIAYPHRLSDQTSAVPRPVFNGGPALLARKPVLLPVRRFLQHGFEFLALAAPERAHLIVIVSHCIVFIAFYASVIRVYFIFLFLKNNIKN